MKKIFVLLFVLLLVSSFPALTAHSAQSNDCATTSNGYMDCDWDNIPDEMEVYIANNYGPLFEYDEHEFVPANRVGFLYQVTPATWTDFAGVRQEGVALVVVGLYPIDVVVIDVPGDWIPILMHFGDTERTVITFKMNPNDYPNIDFTTRDSVGIIQITRHHHDYVYAPNDSELEWAGSIGTNLRIHVSQGKHGGYVSYDECEDFDKSKGVGFDEDCDDGYTIQMPPFPSFNVGEARRPLLEYTHDVPEFRNIFPNSESIWATDPTRFCGGYLVPTPSEVGFPLRGDYDLSYVQARQVNFLDDVTGWIGSDLVTRITDVFGTPPHNCSGGIGSKWIR